MALLTHTAATLPAAWYYDPAQYTRELEAVWYRDWICVGRAEELREAGDYFVAEIGDERIVVTRDRDGHARAFHDTCRHRGSALCTAPRGHFPGGRITCPASDVMESRWLQDTFASVREEILALHRDRTTRDALPRRTIDPQLISRISRHVVRRIISLVRSSRHGATLLFLPPEAAEDSTQKKSINIKYQFADAAPRRLSPRPLRAQLSLAAREGRQSAHQVAQTMYLPDASTRRLASLRSGCPATDGLPDLSGRCD